MRDPNVLRKNTHTHKMFLILIPKMSQKQNPVYLYGLIIMNREKIQEDTQQTVLWVTGK